MGSSTVPTLKLDGRNWKVYQASLLKAAATKGWLGILSGQETNNESLRWEGKDAQLKMLFYQTVPIPLVLKIQNLRTSHEMLDYLATKFQDPTPISIPTKKPIEAPNDDKIEERLEDGLTKARSEGEAEAAVGAAQQTPSQSIEFKEYIPEVPSNLCTAWNELYKQPNLRAGGPLKSKHIKVLNGMVEVPDKVENVNKMAHEDLPSKPCDRSTTNDLPSVRELPLEGEQALCTIPRNPHGIKDKLTSSTMNSQSSYTKEPQPTVYDPGSTLEQPMAHNWAAENEGRLSSPARHEDEASSCMKQHVPNACRVLLEGENTRCTSSDKRNLQEHTNTSRALGMCTHSPSWQEEPTASSTKSAGLDDNTEMPRNAWQNVSTGQTKSVAQDSLERL
ncbi:hypothetical protein F5141DRAFT_1063491 [Pisolithus sp. B1]|nr:hypothetical protein F5141DRAFT_1063491 [Pisolithus sp. B1]